MDFFTSDLHLYDNRFDLLFRPFNHCDEYHNYIVKKWNEKVKKDDTVYCLGDIVFKKNSLKILNKLNGDKRLIKGNHDIHQNDDYSDYFNSVVEKNMTLEIFHNKQKYVFNLDHYPSRGSKEVWNLCGHVHGCWKVQKNIINVSIDCWDYAPVSIDEIIKTIYAIENCYDEDVWVAYRELNTKHMRRGKKGTYYTN